MKDDSDKPLFYAGIGASAGGLKALKSLLSGFSEPHENFCVIIVQHLSSDYKSELSKILSQKSKWPVEEVKSNTTPKAGNIYVTPSDNSIRLKDGKLVLEKEKKENHPTPSINDFFESMAGDAGSQAIGVLLSGYGKDGTAGVKKIKENGGYIICQSPSSAEHPDMPKNAIENELSDAILDPEDIYEEICNYVQNPKKYNSPIPHENNFLKILHLLEERSGTDFSLYKQTSIKRRMEKRMEKLNLKNYTNYLHYIEKNPDEPDKLFNTILIGVTEFFRNRELFRRLKDFLREVIEKKESGSNLRIWSVGCATGEEAYTLAIMIMEILKNDGHLNVQIFATDIDENALNIARKGYYKKEALKNLSKKMLADYFEDVDDGYRIKKSIRQFVLFSRHDITSHPPFVKQDIIVCRNLLIYFNNYLQKEVFKTFHYSLNENGILFLGKSESVSVMPELFKEVGTRFKIFRKKDYAGSYYSLKNSGFPGKNKSYHRKQEANIIQSKNLSLLEKAKETIFNYNENPFVIINEDNEVKEIKGSLRLYMEMTEGKADINLLKMINNELSLELRSLLIKVKKTGEPNKSKIIKFNLFDKNHFVKLRILPLIYSAPHLKYYMVIFESVEEEWFLEKMNQDYSSEDFQNLRIRELEQELMASREHIQTFTEELETSNEELQSLNEELQSANEELKSSNEELETSNEELQSVNEELNTSNAELKSVNKELVQKETELKNSREDLLKSEKLYKTITRKFPNGMVIVIDPVRKVEYIAGKDKDKYFWIDKQKIKGKDFIELIPVEEEKKKIKSMLDKAFKGKECESEVIFNEGYFNIHAIPLIFLKGGKQVEKVMFLAQNITEYKKAIIQTRESEERFKMLADTAPIMIWMEDENMNNIFQSKGWREFTGTKMDENFGQKWLERIHPEDKIRVKESFKNAFYQRKFFKEEYRLKRHDGQFRWILDHGKPRFDEKGEFKGYIGGCIDINGQKELEKKKDEFMNMASHELKTPLTSAKAYIDLIVNKPDISSQSLSFYLQKANNSLTKLTFLINELLDVSRIELGKINLNKEKFEIENLIKNIVSDFERTYPNFKFQFNDGVQKMVKGDKGLMEQVINNLINNAIKYSKENKNIQISLEETENRNIQISVKDFGRGINEDKKEKIFDKFYQADSYDREGLGLGLYLAREIIKSHNGQIKVESKPGEGSKFIVQIPESD